MTTTANQLRKIKSFDQLLAYLRDELDWPIDEFEFDELTYDYEAEELGIEKKLAAKIDYIKQLRPLISGQKWGIFFIKFEPKKLPMVAMRRLLNKLVMKQRSSANNSDQATWRMNDLLFISQYGEGNERKISFAQFAESSGGNLADLKVLTWGDTQTDLTLDDLDQKLRGNLTWPTDPSDADGWRDQWSAAFTRRHGHVINTSKQLAAELAALAKAIFEKAEEILQFETETGALTKLYKAFQQSLIHDLEPKDFADMYAQTITYGLFSTAVSGTDTVYGQGTFVNTERMVQLVPNTNPFLREMLATFLTAGGEKDGLNFDELGINEVVDVLNDPKTDLPAIIREFGAKKKDEDPVIHFYEEFLKAYNAKLRFQRGVFYTPQPVVSYIVRSVHELLQTEFGLEDGLADTTTWGEMVERYSNGNPTREQGSNTSTKRKRVNAADGNEEEVTVNTREPLTIPDGMTADDPFVQILDPATGTATFLVEVIDVIHKTMTAKWKKAGKNDAQRRDAWNEYVPQHLLPRVYGYELMMAPYAIAHMKIGLKLTETGYRFGSNERARIFLTNALEPATSKQQKLADWFPALAHEAAQVNQIKRQVTHSVVLGNPPYAVTSSNNGDHISGLVQVYKDRVKGEQGLVALSDDYLKFIRVSQAIICRSQVGIWGMITNHGYLMGIIHRGVRYELLKQFEQLKIIALHGDSNIGESPPEGQANENVFDIQQGVAIGIGISKGRGNQSVAYGDVWGTRLEKYEQLNRGEFDFVKLTPKPEKFFFVPFDDEFGSEYMTFVSIAELMPVHSCGVKTHRDGVVIDFDRDSLISRMSDIASNSNHDELRQKYGIKDTKHWTLAEAQPKVAQHDVDSFVRPILYRPFDKRWIYYNRDIIEKGDSKYPTLKHMLHDNFALVTSRIQATASFNAVFIADALVEMKTGESSRSCTVFPFALIAETELFETSFNFNQLLRDRFQAATADSFDNFDHLLFFYIYGTLHSPNFRSRYDDFLRTDYPRIPVPGSSAVFESIAAHGEAIANLHLGNVDAVDNAGSKFNGDCFSVEKASWSNETVWIDQSCTSGFPGVSLELWEFEVGGYPLLRKWLKDRQAKGGKNPRQGRKLTKEDIEHYQKMVVAIRETIRLMGEIDEVIDQHGGWPDAFVTEPLETTDQ